MGFEITEASVALTVDRGNFNDTMSRVRASLKRVHGAMEKVSAAAKRMLAVGTVAMGFAVKQASDAQETVSKFEAVFKEQSDAAKEFVAKTAAELKRSKYDLMGYMATVQNTFVPLGFARDAAAEMSKQVTILAEDLASFNNLGTTEVLESLQSALVGNHETVRKFGVIITQATLEQELFRMGVKKGIKDATEQQKALARLNLIIAGTADAQGDAARTSGSFENQMKGLKASVRDLNVEMGSALIPSLTGVIEKIREVLVPVATWISKHQQLTATIITVTGAVLTLAIALPMMTGAMWLADKAAIALSKAVAILNATMMFFAKHPLVLVLTVLATLAAYLAYTRLEGETFGQKMASLAEMIADAFGWLRDTLANLFAPVLPIWNTAITWIKQAVFDLGFAFRNFDALLEIGVLNATLVIVGFANDIKYWFTDALPQYIVWFGDNWKNILKDIASWTKTVLQNIGRNFANFFKAVYDAMKLKGWNFDWTPLTEGFERATEKMPEIAQRNLSPLEKALKEEMDKATKKLGEKYHAERYAVPDVTAPAEKAAMKAKDASEKAAAVSKPNMASIETPKQERSGIGFTGVSEMWNHLASSLGSKDVAKKQLDETVKLNAEQKKHGFILEQIAKHTKSQTTATLA